MSQEIVFHLVQDFPDQMILPPLPSKKLMPPWFKQIPQFNKGDQTVKKCVTFLDAMTAGYTLLNHIDIVLWQKEDGEIRQDFLDDKHEQHMRRWPPIESHPAHQIPGSPMENFTILKYMSPWIIETPKDYSLLFLPPINRLEVPIIPLVGLVDSDDYFNNVNIPFIHTQLEKGGEKVLIPAGTPICQLVPIKREEWTADYTYLEQASLDRQTLTREKVQQDREDWYKKYSHKKKTFK